VKLATWSRNDHYLWIHPDKSCVSPQVFYGSMRTARRAVGMKPSRQWSKPGSLNPGDALESNDTVKLLNARKHR